METNSGSIDRKTPPLTNGALITILVVMIIVLIIAIIIVLINVFYSNSSNGSVAVTPVFQSLLAKKPKSGIPPKKPKKGPFGKKIFSAPGTFAFDTTKTYYFVSVYNNGTTIPCSGCFNGALIGPDAVTGGFVNMIEQTLISKDFAFSLIVPNVAFPIADDTYLIQNPIPTLFSVPWAGQFAQLTLSDSSGGGLAYIGSTSSRDDQNTAQLWTFEKIVNIDTESAVYIIKNVNTDLYIRICDTVGCISCGNVLTCGGGTSQTQFLAVDYTQSEAQSDSRAQFVVTLAS